MASWWSEEQGWDTYEPPELYVCDDVMATLDRRIVGVDDQAVEIKTTARRILDPLPSWIWQTQAQMLATGFGRIHLVVLDGTLELQTFVIAADADAQGELAGRAAKFMDAVRKGELPADTELGYHHRAALTPIDDATTVTLDSDAYALVGRLEAVRKLRKAADEEEDRTKAALAETLGASAAGLWQGRPVITWKTQTRSTINVKRIRSELPEIAEDYTDTSTVRVMRLV